MLNGKITINAFALPDGTIVFTDVLVKLVYYQQAMLDAVESLMGMGVERGAELVFSGP